MTVQPWLNGKKRTMLVYSIVRYFCYYLSLCLLLSLCSINIIHFAILYYDDLIAIGDFANGVSVAIGTNA